MKKLYRIRQNFKVTQVICVIAESEVEATSMANFHQGKMGLNGDLLGCEIVSSRDLLAKDLAVFEGRSVSFNSFAID